jgi:hypothetical protein
MGGVSVAAGDVNGDGRADLIVGAASGADGHVEVIDGTKLTLLRADGVISDAALIYSFLAFDAYQGGVVVAAGNLTGDGVSDVVVAAVTGVSHVKAFSGKTLALVSSIVVQRNDTWGAGLSLGVGDRDNDGRAEILVSFNGGGDTLVHVFEGVGGAERTQFDPFVGFKGAVSLDLLDANNNGRAEIAVTSASGDKSHLKVIDELMAEVASFYVQELGSAGVRVSAL